MAEDVITVSDSEVIDLDFGNTCDEDFAGHVPDVSDRACGIDERGSLAGERTSGVSCCWTFSDWGP
jgi:hypothetical protein